MVVCAQSTNFGLLIPYHGCLSLPPSPHHCCSISLSTEFHESESESESESMRKNMPLSKCQWNEWRGPESILQLCSCHGLSLRCSTSERSVRSAIFVETLRHRPYRELPVATPCVASFHSDAEGVSPKPPAHTLPFSTLTRVSIPISESCAYDRSSGKIMANRIWFLRLQ
jgi:hypothetical protein